MLRDFTWCVDKGASRTTEFSTNTTRFGDGYEQVSSFGINNARPSWSVSVTGYSATVNAVYDFLMEHKGVIPFNMDFLGLTRTYRTEGDINTSHLGGDVWVVSFTVKRVFIP